MKTHNACDCHEAEHQYQIEKRDREIKHLREAIIWYRDEAAALAENLPLKRTNGVMASVQVLALDGGKRADAALTINV